jgi:hypothetical protein
VESFYTLVQLKTTPVKYQNRINYKTCFTSAILFDQFLFKRVSMFLMYFFTN